MKELTQIEKEIVESLKSLNHIENFLNVYEKHYQTIELKNVLIDSLKVDLLCLHPNHFQILGSIRTILINICKKIDVSLEKIIESDYYNSGIDYYRKWFHILASSIRLTKIMNKNNELQNKHQRIDDLNKALMILVNSNNNWRMNLTDEQENHVQNMLDLIF